MIDNKFHPNSRLAKHICDYIALRKKEGYVFEFQTKILLNLDLYLYDYDLDVEDINNKTMDEWRKRRPSEGAGQCNSRNNILNQFVSYLQTLGYYVHISKLTQKVPKNLPYLLSDAETVSVFRSLDSQRPKVPSIKNLAAQSKDYQRLSLEYKVALRLILSCGLRNEEACTLVKTDISWVNDYFLIRKSKGDKDRLVYMTKSMSKLLKEYLDYIESYYAIDTQWAFPGLDAQQPLSKTTLDKKFVTAWEAANEGKACSKHPTVHSLRHKMVINTIDNWTKDGKNMDNMMPYLSRYLGHSDRSETYYYHQLIESLQIVRDHDSKSSAIIPEEIDDE